MLKQLLELRLDNVIYRAGFAQTRLQSRQFAGHGMFLIDGRRVTTPSYRLKPGQVISVREVQELPIFATIGEHHKKYQAPKWIAADSGKLQAEVTALPAPEDAEQAVDMRLVIEFYSRN